MCVFYVDNLQVRGHSGHPGLDRKTVLKRILEEWLYMIQKVSVMDFMNIVMCL